MNDFVKLILNICQTNETRSTLSALESFIREASPSDCLWMLAIFMGREPKKSVSSSNLKKWALEKAKISYWLYKETKQVVGEIAETLSLLLPNPSSVQRASLTNCMIAIRKLANQSLNEKKMTVLSIWDQLEHKERWIFNKLLLGNFDINVSLNNLAQALANIRGTEVSVIVQHLMKNWDPIDVSYNFLYDNNKQCKTLSPYPFCLAAPLDVELEELGPCSNWSAEWKWDGLRCQLVYRNNKITLWLRNQEIVNDFFPEITALQHILSSECVLDGEIIAYQDSRIMSFQQLEKRFHKNKLSSKILKNIPAIFLAYDLLEWKGKDWREKPLIKRQKQLAKIIQQTPTHSLHFSLPLNFSSWEDLKALYHQSRQYQAEGIMLKQRKSSYHSGHNKGIWWKWKIEPFTVDAIMIYAQKKIGDKINIFSDYTFAVWSKNQLIPIVKTSLGITTQEALEIDHYIKTHTIEKFGPVYSIQPKLVFEIAFEGLQSSKRHKAGFVLSLPYIRRWRHDKSPQEADTIEFLQALFHHNK